jgi:hypothetical protein
MRHPLPALATLLTAAALVAACGGGGADASTGPAADNQLVVELDWIDVIQDCDGIEGKGDFTFTLYAQQKNQPDVQIYKGSPTVGAGERFPLARVHTFVVPASDGDSYVNVGFEATEWDKNIFGTVYADSRLDDVREFVQHKLTNGTWSRLGTQTITLGTGTPNDCNVKLTYKAYRP